MTIKFPGIQASKLSRANRSDAHPRISAELDQNLDQDRNWSNFMFIVTEFKYEVILTSQLVISSSILLFVVNFTHVKLCAQF